MSSQIYLLLGNPYATILVYTAIVSHLDDHLAPNWPPCFHSKRSAAQHPAWICEIIKLIMKFPSTPPSIAPILT